MVADNLSFMWTHANESIAHCLQAGRFSKLRRAHNISSVRQLASIINELSIAAGFFLHGCKVCHNDFCLSAAAQANIAESPAGQACA